MTELPSPPSGPLVVPKRGGRYRHCSGLYEEEPMKAQSSSRYRTPVRSELLETLQFLGVDSRKLAMNSLPKLIAPLETDYDVREMLIELGTYGRIASPAVPALIRHCRLRTVTIAKKRLTPSPKSRRTMRG